MPKDKIIESPAHDLCGKAWSKCRCQFCACCGMEFPRCPCPGGPTDDYLEVIRRKRHLQAQAGRAMATRQATTWEALMTLEQALEKADTVYRRLLAQGRSEPDARRDAERWVKGNHGVDVTLPAPVRRKQTGHVYATRIEYGAATINYSHFASAATAVSEEMADLFRTMAENEERRDRRGGDHGSYLPPTGGARVARAAGE